MELSPEHALYHEKPLSCRCGWWKQRAIAITSIRRESAFDQNIYSARIANNPEYGQRRYPGFQPLRDELSQLESDAEARRRSQFDAREMDTY